MANSNDPINKFLVGDLADTTKPTFSGAGTLSDTTRAPAFGRVEGFDPAAAFEAGRQAGSQSLLSTTNYFRALGNSLLGDEEAMQNAILDAQRAEGDSAAYLSEFQSFEEFLDQPTFSGFLNQAFLATGQFTPTALASVLAAFTGAGIGAVVGGSALKMGGSAALTNLAAKKVAEKEFRELALKRLKNEAMDVDDELLEDAIYQQLRRDYMKKASTRGALTGAFASEYPQLAGVSFGTFAEQDMTDPVSAFTAAGIGVPAAAIGVGGEALVAKYFLNKLKKGDGPVHKSIIRAMGKGAVTTGGIEGLTELAQEEINIQQKFAIDPDYTAAHANLDRAHSAFAGFFGGAGLGSLGGTVTGVVEKARSYVDEKYANEQYRQFNVERYGDNEAGDVYKEPADWLEAQFNALFDPNNSKDSVYLDTNSFNQMNALVQRNPELAKRIDEELLQSEVNPENYRHGALFTTNQNKLDQFVKTTVENPLNSIALDNTLVDILGYEHSRKPEDDMVVEVLDENGNPVWYQSTNVKDASAVEAKARELFPKGKIVKKNVKQHLEERNAKLDETVETRDITIEEETITEAAGADYNALVQRYRALSQKANEVGGINNLPPQEREALLKDYGRILQIQTIRKQGTTQPTTTGPVSQKARISPATTEDPTLDRYLNLVEKARKLGGIDKLSAEEQQTLRQDFIALQPNKEGAFSPDEEVQANYLFSEGVVVEEGEGSEATPIRPKKNKAEIKQAKEEAKKASQQSTPRDPLAPNVPPVTVSPEIFKEGWKAGQAREQANIDRARELVEPEFLEEFNRNISEGNYSDSLLKAFIKQAEDNPSFAFRIDEVVDSEGNSKGLFNIKKLRLPLDAQNMELETAKWVSEAKRIESKRVRKDKKRPTFWTITNLEKGEAGQQQIYMPLITRFGTRNLDRQGEMSPTAETAQERALLGFTNAVTELLLNGYQLYYRGVPFTFDSLNQQFFYEAPVLSLPSQATETNPDGLISLFDLITSRGEFDTRIGELEQQIAELDTRIEDTLSKTPKDPGVRQLKFEQKRALRDNLIQQKQELQSELKEIRDRSRDVVGAETDTDFVPTGPGIVEGQRLVSGTLESPVVEQVADRGVVRDPDTGEIIGRKPAFAFDDSPTDTTDVPDVRAKTEFDLRDRFSFLEIPKQKGTTKTTINISPELKSRLKEGRAVDELIRIIKEEFKFNRNLQVILADDSYDNAFVQNQQQIVLGAVEDSNGIKKPLLGRILSNAETDVIIINLPQDATLQQQSEAMLALLHEVGHAVFKQEFINSLSNKTLLNNLLKEFENARQTVGSKSYDGQNGFEEWYADQIGAYLLNRSKKATNQTQSFFKRIANKVERAFKKFGQLMRQRFELNPSFESYVDNLLQSYKDGAKDPIRNPITAEDRIFIRNMADEMVPKALKGFVTPAQMQQLKKMAENILSSDNKIPRAIKYWIYDADNFVRSLGKNVRQKDREGKEMFPNGVGAEIAKIFYSRSQSGEKTGFLTAKISAINGYLSELFTILDITDASGITQEALDILLEAEDNQVDTENLSPKAREVREWLSEFYDRRELKSLKIGKLSNYFPRVISDFLVSSSTLQSKLVDLLVQYNEGKTFKRPKALRDKNGQPRMKDGKIMYEVDKEGSPVFEDFTVTPEYARLVVDGIVKNMGDQKVVDSGQDAADIELQELGVGLVKHRAEIFASIPNKALRDAKDENGDSLAETPLISLQKYITNVVKKTEYRKRGGAAKVQRLINSLPKEQREQARAAVDAMLGKVNPEMSQAFKQANSWLLTFNIVTLLPFAVLASLPDFAGPILRSKELKSVPRVTDILLPYLDGLVGDIFGGELSAKKRQELAQFAKDIGVVSTDAINTMYINAAELDFMVPAAKKFADAFFYGIGLEWFTKFTRIFAGGMGKAFLIDHGKRARLGEERSIRYLKELNLTWEQVDVWNKGGQKVTGAENEEVRLALARFVDESIVRPNAAERPVWASDPRFALVWQLKSFFYAYGKNIVGGLMRESKNRFNESGFTSASIPLLLAAATLLPLTMLGLDIRERFKIGLDWLLPFTGPNADSGFFESSGKNYRRSVGMDWGEYSFEILDRSGVFGPFALAMPLFMESKRYGDPFWVGPLGPTVERGYDFIEGDLRFKDILPGYSIGL
jgi:hypothetical protein